MSLDSLRGVASDRTPVTNRTLVVENDPTDDARRLGGWLTEGGLAPEVCWRNFAAPFAER